MAYNLFSTFTLVFSPVLIGLLILCPYFPNSAVKIRRFAKGFATIHLFYSSVILLLLNSESTDFDFISKLPFNIIPNADITMAFGLDGFSTLMCVLSSFMTLLVLMASKSMIKSKQKLYYPLILFAQTAATGIFAANNLFTFFLFWQFEIIPLYFLISLWGGNRAKKYALRYAVAIFLGSLFMLVGTGFIYAYCNDFKIMTDIGTLIQKKGDFPLAMELLAVVGFLIAFLVKIPIFPFHNTIEKIQNNASVPVCMFLNGVTINTALYGFVRINIQMLYKIFQIIAPTVIFLGSISVLWCAFRAISQKSIKKLLSLLSIAQTGIIVAALASFTEFGLEGGVLQVITHSFVFTGLFMCAGIIYLKFKIEKIDLLTGIASSMPLLSAFIFILALCLAQIPFTLGFFGGLLSLSGAFNSPLIEKQYFLANFIQTAVILTATGIFIYSIGIFKFLYKVLLGIPDEKYAPTKYVLLKHQTAILIVVCAGLIIFGFYPSGIIDKISTFVQTNINTITTEIF